MSRSAPEYGNISCSPVRRQGRRTCTSQREDRAADNCGASFNNDKALGIGLAYGAADSYGWKGGICHVRVYKGYVLTDADVEALFNAKA